MTTLSTKRPESDGFRTRTLNSTGFTWQQIAPISLQWTQFQGPGPSIEIGCCYGDTSLLALRNGLQVVANNLSSHHLEIFSDSLPEEHRANLTLLPGRFPDELDLPSASIGSVLASSVFHFLDGDSIKTGLSKIERWLAPGGKLFLIAETPFMGILQDFPYEERKKRLEYPGTMSRSEFAQYSQYAQQVPEVLNWLDADVLRRDVSRLGFKIEYLDYFTRPNLPPHLKWDGRESVGLIAERV